MNIKVYLHIGAHKTGTTYLQKYLERNYKQLLDQGVLYPKFTDEIFIPHHIITRPLTEPKLNDFIWDIGALTESASHLNSLSSIRKRLLFEVERTNASTVILSTEFLFAESNIFDNTVKNHNKFSYIKELLEGFDVEIVCYLREPISWLESCYVEAVKGPHTCFGSSFDDYIKRLSSSDVDYVGSINSWEMNFDNVNVRFFEDAIQLGGIEYDFVNLLSLDCSNLDFEVIESEKNLSYDKNWLEILRAFNNINSSRDIGTKYPFPFLLEDILQSNDGGKFKVREEQFPHDFIEVINSNRIYFINHKDNPRNKWQPTKSIPEDECPDYDVIPFVVEQFLKKNEQIMRSYQNKEHELLVNQNIIENKCLDKFNSLIEKNSNLKLDYKLLEEIIARKDREIESLESEFSTLRRIKSKLVLFLGKYIKNEKNISDK